MPSISLIVLVATLLVALAVDVTHCKGPPRINENYHRRHLVNAGESLRLSCPVQGDPAPIIAWDKDGYKIHIGWDRIRVKQDVLHIVDTETEDSGVYTCSATNGFGSINVEYLVYVAGNGSAPAPDNFDKDFLENTFGSGEPPQFVIGEEMREDDINLPLGGRVELHCRGTGRPTPAPAARWFKNGQLIPDSYRSEGTSRWDLLLREVTNKDGGEYMCMLFNRAGSVNHTYTVHIQDVPHVQESITPVVENVSTVIGSVASLQCEVDSNVPVRIQWLRRLSDLSGDQRRYNLTLTIKDETYLLVQHGIMTSKVDETYQSTLRIQPVTWSDAGAYICSAANSRGLGFETAFLDVFDDKPIQSKDGVQVLLIFSSMAAIFGVVIIGLLVFVVYRQCGSKSRQSTPRQSPSPLTSAYLPSIDDNKKNDQCFAAMQHDCSRPMMYCPPTGSQFVPSTGNQCNHNEMCSHAPTDCVTIYAPSQHPAMHQPQPLQKVQLHYYADF